MLGSGFFAQPECVFLLFSFNLVLFSSNSFDLETNFFGSQPFLVFREWFLGLREFIFLKIGTFRFLERKLLVPRISALQIAYFFTINAHYQDHRSHLNSLSAKSILAGEKLVAMYSIST
jgi:hypothetical protein